MDAVNKNALRARIGGWTPGVSIGLAIYAGMFVAAGAWRSDEVSEAVANGQGVQIAYALHSFQVVVADASTSTMQIALAPSTPSASFVQPQRVALTAALDSASTPIVADAPAVIAASADYVPAPVRLHPIEASLTAPANALQFDAQDVVELLPLTVFEDAL